MARLISTIYLFSALSISAALQVTPGSACAKVCLDTSDANPSDPGSSNTDTADIACKNNEYSTTGVGTKYKSCLDCLMTSDSVDEVTGETDVAWFLCMDTAALAEVSREPSLGYDGALTPNLRQPPLRRRRVLVRIWEHDKGVVAVRHRYSLSSSEKCPSRRRLEGGREHSVRLL